MDNDILKNLQDAALLVYEERAMDLLKCDQEYQQLSKREKECEKEYERIREKLSETDAKIINEMMVLRDRGAALYDFWIFVIGIEIGRCFRKLLCREGKNAPSRFCR